VRSRVSSYVAVILALMMVGGLYTAFMSPKSKADDSTNQSMAVTEGRQLYLQGCSTCHGLDNQGLTGPSLIGVGSAAVVFQVGSGRMPLASGSAQAPRKEVKYDRTQIDQLAAYIQSKGGGPEAPADVDYSDGDLALGGDLFRTNCSSCHNFAGAGGALTRSKYAPALKDADARVIYTAMQSGPENMPRFSDNTLTPQEKKDIVKYVRFITSQNKDPGGAALGHYGPIPEGLVIFLVGIGLCIVVTLWIGARA
jgi:ubiquinol-cytochrome c reductase cytochrome c subunit